MPSLAPVAQAPEPTTSSMAFAPAAIRSWRRAIIVHSLSWLVAANLVGLWLATLLLVPALGGLLPGLGYGRWATLHLDLHLYGWLSLPLVGILLSRYRVADDGRCAGAAVSAWSAALGIGAVSWLAGVSSGKPFLEWRGGARVALLAAMMVLAAVLAAAWWRGRKVSRWGGWRVAGFALVPLAILPVVLYLAADPRIYPPINPASGGPTGTSLLGSVLSLVIIVLGVPHLAELPAAHASAGSTRGVTTHGRLRRWIWSLLLVHSAIFLAYGHGDRPHHELGQILSLASVAVWWPATVRYLRTFTWPAGSRPWLGAVAAWSAALIVDGVFAFMPGVLERWKFTNALVAHAHVAMAGLASSLAVLFLVLLGQGVPTVGLFGDRLAFVLWHGGTAAMVVVLTLLGTLEGLDPGLVPRGGGVVTVLYFARWVAGCAMAAASIRWLRAALDPSPTAGPSKGEWSDG